jgi:hypothetical protein
MIRAATYRAIVLLVLPARLVHELLHAVAALPWARRIQLDILPQRGDAVARVAWRGEPPHAVVALSALAPLLAGLIAAGAAVGLLVSGAVSAPSTVRELALLAIGAAYVGLVAQPSARDLQRARGDRDE